MDASGATGIRIEKLSDTNFFSWKQKMEIVLGHREVDDKVDPILCPRLPKDPEELHQWIRKDKTACMTIGLSLSDGAA